MRNTSPDQEHGYSFGEQSEPEARQPFWERVRDAAANTFYVIDEFVPIRGLARRLHLIDSNWHMGEIQEHQADGTFLD